MATFYIMKKQGKQIIETLFKRRTECATICSRIASKTEVDSDRSDIRVFEVGVSAEQYGNYEQGTRTTHRIAIAYSMESAKYAND